MSKIISVIALAGVVALTLVGCSAGSTTDAKNASTSCVATKSGSGSEKVEVKGKVGAVPTVTIPTPLTVTKTERSVVVKGKGTQATAGSPVTINYAVYNATSGKELDTTGFGASKAQPLTLTDGSIIPGLYKALLCSTVGSRVAAIIPPADAFGTTGQSDLGIAATDSIVFVIDVVTAKKPVKALAKANGAPQAAPKGYPTVKLAKSGEPTITVPKTAAPTKLEIADLKKGTGATVKDGATVTVQYTGVVWDSGQVFDSSWSSGTPATFTTSGVIPGFSKALVGQKVGSQVIAIIPPADGYGDNVPTGQTAITATSTLVFVVDILATQ
ncbi:MAG TPA: FKBP-type peptidyl-prolyl cis-trans isomerase [Lacisediminihabitans sp.]|uniref:FKBP-type peptidyl-prolyl cis-trans isomerase n=1 Tax=Lacisediminihabitans sp. TaxID=2787631 RepID=UPI002EDA3F3F